MLALMLLSLVGGVGSTTVEKITSASTMNWNPIAMSADGSKAAASANDQIYLSVDGGATWPRTSKRAGKLHMTRDGSKLFGWTMMSQYSSNPQQIQMSSDDAQTWTEIGESLAWNGVGSSTDGTKLVGIVYNGNIHLSSDTGATWTDSGIGPQKWYAVVMSADGTKIAALVEGGKLWISSDSGATFSEVDAEALSGASWASNSEWGAIAMSSDGTKIVVCAKSGGVLTSQDSAASWTQGSPQGETRALHWRSYRGVGISDDGMTVVATHYGNGDGNVWISYDGGATFVAHATESYYEQIALSADGSKFIASASGTNGGLYLGTVLPPTSTMTNTTTATTKTTTGTMTMTMTETVTMTMTETMTGVTATATTTPDAGAGSADTTTSGDSGANVVEVTLTLTVDDPAVITENATLTNAMIQGFADVMGVEASQVTLEFEVARRLRDRRLQVQLQAIFSVTFPDAAAAAESKDAIQAVSVSDTNQAISDAVVGAGFGGTIEVTGKETVIAAAPEGPTGGAMPALTVGVLTQLAIALLQT